VDIAGLVLQLGDPDTAVRVAAREALIAAGPVAIPDLVAALLDERSKVIPIVAAGALASYGDAAIGPMTAALAAAPSDKARSRVNWGYARLEPSDPAQIVAALRHPSAAVRASAASWLHARGAAAPFITELLPLLSDPDPTVRSTAKHAIFGAGGDAVATLQDLRCTPGRHRRFALTALAEIGGWQALAPADQSAVRRLIGVKMPRERPAPMHLGDAWYAVPSAGEAGRAAILDEFRVTGAERVTMRLGESAWNNGLRYDPDHRHRSCAVIYVSPSLDGWTLIFGRHPDDLHPVGDQRSAPTARAAALSERFGACHWYALSDGDDTAAWCIAEQGKVLNWYDSEDPDAAIGPKPEDFRADARVVAARLSVDPGALNPDTRVEGHGTLALTECGRRYGPPPGALTI
jgi:hypothetical protein